MMESEKEKQIEKQIEARKKLMLSAKMAKNVGFSWDEWMTSDVVLNFVAEVEMDKSILDHIGNWVWISTKRR